MADKEEQEGVHHPSEEEIKNTEENLAKIFDYNFDDYISKSKKLEDITIFDGKKEYSIYIRDAKIHRFFVIDLVDEEKKQIVAKFGVDLYEEYSGRINKERQIAVISQGAYLKLVTGVNALDLLDKLIDLGVISKCKEVINQPDNDEFSQIWICDVLKVPEAKL